MFTFTTKSPTSTRILVNISSGIHEVVPFLLRGLGNQAHGISNSKRPISEDEFILLLMKVFVID